MIAIASRRALAAVVAVLAVLAVLAVSGLTVSGPPAASAAGEDDTSSVPSRATLTLTGHGYGHGHGMSQYGARGAARQGLSWRQIVGFYYPGTQVVRAGGTIKVLITADTSRDIVVDAQPALRLHRLKGRTLVLAKLRSRATRWRIVPVGRSSRVEARLRGGGKGWSRVLSFPGTAEFAAGRRPITLRLPGKQVATYRGTLRTVDKQTVNVVALEDYVRGVVPAEMPATWEPQAVRAQAVAARTYAAFERATSTGGYDLCDTAACQVYGGVEAQQPGADQAARRTAHRIVGYQGAPAFTQFSSSDGGYNSAGSAPYLVAQADPYEASSDNPYATWTVQLTDAEIEQAFPQVGDLREITLGDRDGYGEWGGRIGDVRLRGSLAGLPTAVDLSGDEFRIGFDLRSTYVTVSAVSAGRSASES